MEAYIASYPQLYNCIYQMSYFSLIGNCRTIDKVLNYMTISQSIVKLHNKSTINGKLYCNKLFFFVLVNSAKSVIADGLKMSTIQNPRSTNSSLIG